MLAITQPAKSCYLQDTKQYIKKNQEGHLQCLVLTLSLYSGHKRAFVLLYLCLLSGYSLLATLTATKEVQVTGLFWCTYTSMTFRGEMILYITPLMLHSESRNKIITVLMGLLRSPVISDIWRMVLIKPN